jgi:tetratricopeptide (TPR) repeat protein
MFRKWIALLLWAVPFGCAAQNIDFLILNNDYPQALSQIENSLQARPDAELYLKQARIYRQLSNPMLAAQALENSIALDSVNARYLAEYAELQAELGNPYKAVKFYQRAVDNSTNDLNLECSLGRAYLNIENYPKAFEVLRNLQSKDSTNLVYNKLFGLAAFRTGKSDLAIRMFESVLDRNPYDFGTYMNLIPIYLMKKNAVQIVRTADLASYFFPENQAILLREANSLYSIREYEEARPVFERYLALGDSAFDVLEDYGISLYFSHDDVNARKILEKCFASNPTKPFVNFYLGLICKRMSDFSRSIEFFTMAIATSQPPYLTDMYHHLGQVYGLQREFTKSIESLQQAYNYNPLKTEVLVEIATTYEEFDPNKKNALNYYSKYLKEAGDSAVNAKYAQERITALKEKLRTSSK